MLRINNRQKFEDDARLAVNRELYLCRLLEGLFSDKVSLKPAGSEEVLSQDLSSYYVLKSRDGMKVGFDFTGIYPAGDSLQYFMRLIEYSHALKENDFYLADPETMEMPCLIIGYELKTEKGISGLIKVSLPLDYSLFYPGAADNIEQAPGAVRLQLGAIEIGVGSFLQLKEGMEIVCDLPHNFPALLEFSSEKLASVSAQIEGQKIRLKVMELATFRQNPR